MNWAEAMKEHAVLAARDPVAVGLTVAASPRASSWEPHEVWLTRVKRPRDLKSLRPANDLANEAVGLLD